MVNGNPLSYVFFRCKLSKHQYAIKKVNVCSMYSMKYLIWHVVWQNLSFDPFSPMDCSVRYAKRCFAE